MRGRTNLIVRIVDSDIIVILLEFREKFLEIDPDTSIEVDYGVTNILLINIHDFHRMVGDSISNTAIFFHTLSGCDSTASFYKKHKKYIVQMLDDFCKKKLS